MMEVINIDDYSVSMFGDYHVTLLWTPFANQVESILRTQVSGSVHNHQGLLEVRGREFVSESLLEDLRFDEWEIEVQRLSPVLPISSFPGMSTPFSSCGELLNADAGRGISLARHAINYEMQRSGLNEEAVIDKMLAIVRILRKSIQQGIAGTEYADRILPPQTPSFAAALQSGKLLDGGAMNKIVLYVSALMEVKSSMGVIVAAPTAGACAALPAAVIAMAEALGKGEREMAEALLASGLIGVFIASPWTFAAEVGGCQAEGGSAAAMAASALVTLAGGTLQQSLTAASLAMQSMIGLICDPVGNRVEVPCLGKNVMAATNALACANMALAGFAQIIPFDEVVETAMRVAQQMPRELRCTNLGGLSTTPTSQAIEADLAARKSCGSGCGCAVAPRAAVVVIGSSTAG
jgi:L-serine dehydratase